MKTGKEIQHDFYLLLKGSSLLQVVSGGLYKAGHRPHGSREEDIVVVFTTSTAEQVQEGVVTIRIYVPDIDPYDSGVLEEDGFRAMELERAAQDWFDNMSRSEAPMRLRLQGAVETLEDYETKQHYVSMRIRFNYLNN